MKSEKEKILQIALLVIGGYIVFRWVRNGSIISKDDSASVVLKNKIP